MSYEIAELRGFSPDEANRVRNYIGANYDGSIRDAFCGGSVTISNERPSDRNLVADLAKIQERFKAMPPPPILASSKLFLADCAICFTVDGQEYVLAHPEFWAQVPARIQQYHWIPGIQIHDLDAPEHRHSELRWKVLVARRRARAREGVGG